VKFSNYVTLTGYMQSIDLHSSQIFVFIIIILNDDDIVVVVDVVVVVVVFVMITIIQ